MAVRAAGWKIRKAPVLGDQAYGDNTERRDRLHAGGLQYVLSVSPETTVFTTETKFTAPEPRSGPGRKRSHPRPRSCLSGRRAGACGARRGRART